VSRGLVSTATDLAIGFAAVAHANHKDSEHSLLNLEYDSIIADAAAEKILKALELLDSALERIQSQAVYAIGYFLAPRLRNMIELTASFGSDN